MLPHLVLLLEENQLPTNPQVNVYKVASGASEGSLVKSLSLDSPGSYCASMCKCIYNNLLLGFVHHHRGEDGRVRESSFHVFEKNSLVDENKTARRRQIALPFLYERANMNTTNLVYKRRNEPGMGVALFKRDFWID